MDAENSVTPEGPNADLSEIKRKTKFTGTVVKTTLAGAIVDIGLGIPGVVHISQLRREAIKRVEEVVQVGQCVQVWVKRVDAKKGRIDLTMIEPLALEWREISKGLVVKGRVVKLEKFGAFVDIGAERPGLVHISEMTREYIKSPADIAKEGDEVEVQVLEVNRRKKQIRLSMKALEEKVEKVEKTPKTTKPVNEKAPETEKETPIPTAMEIAMRQAMERSFTRADIRRRRRRKNAADELELEDILENTFKNKIGNNR